MSLAIDHGHITHITHIYGINPTHKLTRLEDAVGAATMTGRTGTGRLLTPYPTRPGGG